MQEMPKTLFKYRDYTNEYNRKTLFDFEIYLASTATFNDPYEGDIPFRYEPKELTEENIFRKFRELAYEEHPDWSEEEIHEFCYNAQQKDLLNDEAHIEQRNKINKKDIENTFGILSLTPNPMNYLMWSHYANSHTGYCIGFDSKLLFDEIGGALVKVKYETELPKLKLFEDIREFQQKLLATKMKDWEYEDEYRLININPPSRIVTYSKEMIKEIFLGCNMPLENKNKIIEFVKSNAIDCQVFDLSLDKTVFKLSPLNIY